MKAATRVPPMLLLVVAAMCACGKDHPRRRSRVLPFSRRPAAVQPPFLPRWVTPLRQGCEHGWVYPEYSGIHFAIFVVEPVQDAEGLGHCRAFARHRLRHCRNPVSYMYVYPVRYM